MPNDSTLIPPVFPQTDEPVEVGAGPGARPRSRAASVPTRLGAADPLLMRLLARPSSPFHESAVLGLVRSLASERGLRATTDRWGNVTIDLPTDRAAALACPLLLSAHADHPGFWAERMLDRTTVLAHWVGRVPRSYFDGAAVRFSPPSAPAIRGRITRVRRYRGEGDHAVVEAAVDRAVPPGSVGQWDLPGPEVVDGRVHATAIDDLAGCAALLRVMEAMSGGVAARPVRLLFTRAEEAGFIGCIGYCRDRLAEARGGRSVGGEIVGVEMSKAMPDAPVGGGPVVRVGDRRSVFDPETTERVAHAAEAVAARDPGFRYQRKLMDGGTCESSVFQSLLGRCGAVCLPLGHYHNVNEAGPRLEREYIDLSDYTGLIELLLELCRVSPGPSSRRDASPTPTESWEGLWSRHAHLLSDAVGGPREVAT